MPTPRAHGGAALVNFPLTTPAFKGLNTQFKNSILSTDWATKLQNAVIDGNGRLAARKGWSSLTGTTPAGAKLVQIIEYRKTDGTVHIFGTSETAAYASTDNGDIFADVTGTAAFTDGNWQLCNYNDFVIGFQSGEAPLIYNGTTCSQVADGSAPTGGVGCSAFGRLWAVDSDGTTLKYCALLDHTDWSGSDTGSFDLTNVWPGFDQVVAVTEYNGALVIFGSHNILFYVDGSGSPLGIDPTQMYIVDSITGLGCGARDSVQAVSGDLWFLGDDYNLHSLQRVIQEKSPPIVNLTRNVSDDLRDAITLTGFDTDNLRALYSPQDRFYLLFLPRESSSGAGDEVGQTWVFDTRGRLEDGTVRCMGQWDANVATAATRLTDGTIIWCLQTVTGEVGQYAANTDDGSSYAFDYESGWSDLTEQSLLLILKRLNGVFYYNSDTSIVLKWGFDFVTTLTTKTLEFTGAAAGGEWGIGEWGIAEWSGGVTLTEKKAAGTGTGEFIKVGAKATITGSEFAMQRLDAYAKVGRLT